MMVITIRKFRLKLAVAALMAVGLLALGVNQIFSSLKANEFKDIVEALREVPFEASDAEVLTSTTTAPDPDKDIQLFDISKGKVVKNMAPSPVFQDEAEKIIISIAGLYVKVKPFPETGYIVKIPLNPRLNVQNLFISATIDKIFVIFTKDEAPLLLVLDQNERPYIYTFTHSTQKLLDTLKYPFDYR